MLSIIIKTEDEAVIFLQQFIAFTLEEGDEMDRGQSMG